MTDLPRDFPVGPAADALTRYMRQRRLSRAQLPQALGLPYSLIRQCFEGRRLRFASADRLACALGRHPGELWRDWFGRAEAPAELRR